MLGGDRCSNQSAYSLHHFSLSLFPTYTNTHTPSRYIMNDMLGVAWETVVIDISCSRENVVTDISKTYIQVLRWRRNRKWRPLSPSQIPQKNISTLSKLHKTTSVGWQRTSGNQKSRPLSSKTVNLSGCPSMWRNFSSLT